MSTLFAFGVARKPKCPPLSKCTEGGFISLVLSVQQIMAGLKRAATEDDVFVVVMTACNNLVMK